MANLYEKIQNVKLKFLQSNIKKSGYNKFANFTYYELADILPTLIKLCNEEKLFTAVSFGIDTAVLTIKNIEKPDEFEIYTSPMKDLDLKGCNAIQALGGAETYSRRYLYMSAFDIIENDMFDAVVNETEKPQKITEEQATVLKNTLESMGVQEEDLKKSLKNYKVSKIEDLDTKQYGEILVKLNKNK